MDFRWAPEFHAFRDELTAFIAQWRTPELLEEHRADHGAVGPSIRRFQQAIDAKGWNRMCWPETYGGLGRDPLYQFVYVETMEYWGMPYGNRWAPCTAAGRS